MHEAPLVVKVVAGAAVWTIAAVYLGIAIGRFIRQTQETEMPNTAIETKRPCCQRPERLPATPGFSHETYYRQCMFCMTLWKIDRDRDRVTWSLFTRADYA